MTPERFWHDFCAERGVAADHRHDVYRFGNSDEMADELLALVIDGPKRATAAAVFERFELVWTGPSTPSNAADHGAGAAFTP